MSVTTDDQADLTDIDGDRVNPADHGRADLLDAEQISAELIVNVKTVRRWMSTRQLRNFKLGPRRVTRRAWLEQFLDELS